MLRPEPLAKRPSAEMIKPLPTTTNWVVTEIREVPSFYPLEKSSRVIEDTPSNIATRISDACREMSVYAVFDDVLATAELYTGDHVEIHLTLWRGSESKEKKTSTIVEAQRRKGCPVVYHKYFRNIFDAAQGYELKEYGVKQYRLGSELATSAEKKEEDGESNSLMALEIAASLLKKDRMDARRLGMESLCLLTDPAKTGMENALLASQVVLFGSVPEADVKTGDAEFIPDELGIREAIISLVQFGKLGEHYEFDSEDEGEEDKSDVEAEFNSVLHNLALAVLSNSLEVLELHGNKMAATASRGTRSSTNSFLEESEEISNRELISTLLNVLGKAESKPHDACLSAQCLRSLFQASKEAKRRARDLNAKQIVMTALDVGRRTHVKLETETKNIIEQLEKPDEEEGVAGTQEQREEEGEGDD